MSTILLNGTKHLTLNSDQKCTYTQRTNIYVHGTYTFRPGRIDVKSTLDLRTKYELCSLGSKMPVSSSFKVRKFL